MKLTKDQLQKVILSAIGFAILIYVYFTFFLGPLNKSRASMIGSIASLQKKIGDSNGEMRKGAVLEEQAKTATTRFAALKALSPEGAPIAWFPPRMKTFFAAQEIDKATARLDSSSAFKQPELADWMKYAWQIDLPQTDFAALGKAVAALENTEPLLSTSRLSLKASAEDPQHQQALLSVSTVIVRR
ncbi:MAG: hypothetical protein ABI871_00385 [Chthoniobacterales bacterium]